MSDLRVVPISAISSSGLTTEEQIDALSMAMTELAIAWSLRIIHGEQRGAALYVERGGHVRFDGEEPVLLYDGLDGPRWTV